MSDQWRPTAGDLERRLLGERPWHTREELAEAAGMRLDRARRFWRALGFPDVGHAQAFTDADAAALARLKSLVDDGLLDEDTALRLVRALGTTMARLAEWEAEAIAEMVTRRVGEQPGSSRLVTAYELAERLVPEFERLQAYVWQRHLAAAALRLERLGALEQLGAADGSLLSRPLTVGFADLVGFTRLSRRIEQAELAELIERFEAVAADRIAWHGARLVKTLGDSVLFVAGTARDGVAVGLSLVADLSEEGLPPLRVGVGTGQVITRFGDVYGETVNRASRLTALARRNTVVSDAATVRALDGAPGLRVRRMPPRRVRGLGRVPWFVVQTS